jgi:hypothetical protein
MGPSSQARHVLAAGIAANASTIITWNLRDFPVTDLKKHNLRAAAGASVPRLAHEERPPFAEPASPHFSQGVVLRCTLLARC